MSILHTIHALKEEKLYERKHIEPYFYFLPNQAQGDCLFESMSQLLYKNSEKTQSLRQEVADFYKSFDDSLEYPVNTIEDKIKLTLLADPYDDSGELHKTNIAKDNVFANLGDIFVLSKIHRCNILLLKQEGMFYRVIPIKNKGGSVFYHIRMISDEHFEACLPVKINITRIHRRPKLSKWKSRKRKTTITP